MPKGVSDPTSCSRSRIVAEPPGDRLVTVQASAHGKPVPARLDHCTVCFSEPQLLPMTYLVDQAGRIVSAHAGLLDLDLVEREIRALQDLSSR